MTPGDGTIRSCREPLGRRPAITSPVVGRHNPDDLQFLGAERRNEMVVVIPLEAVPRVSEVLTLHVSLFMCTKSARQIPSCENTLRASSRIRLQYFSSLRSGNAAASRRVEPENAPVSIASLRGRLRA